MLLLWRAYLLVSNGPHDIQAIEIDRKPMV